MSKEIRMVLITSGVGMITTIIISIGGTYLTINDFISKSSMIHEYAKIERSRIEDKTDVNTININHNMSITSENNAILKQNAIKMEYVKEKAEETKEEFREIKRILNKW